VIQSEIETWSLSGWGAPLVEDKEYQGKGNVIRDDDDDDDDGGGGGGGGGGDGLSVWITM